MAKIKHARVVSCGPTYKLILSLEAQMAGFTPLQLLVFPRYRAAQDIANAVKTSMAKRQLTKRKMSPCAATWASKRPCL